MAATARWYARDVKTFFRCGALFSLKLFGMEKNESVGLETKYKNN